MASHAILVIGGSLGAVDALARIFADFPSDLPAAVFVVVHIGNHGFDPSIGLGSQSLLPVTVDWDGIRVEPGKIVVAPPDRRLLLLDGVVRLGCVIGVVLTGELNDGAAGLAAVKQCGGVAVVQNPADAQADGMPLGALRSCQVDYRASVAEAQLYPAWTRSSFPAVFALPLANWRGRPPHLAVLCSSTPLPGRGERTFSAELVDARADRRKIIGRARTALAAQLAHTRADCWEIIGSPRRIHVSSVKAC